MPKSVPSTSTASQTEIMIRNMQVAGFSEDDVHYEMAGYGCERTFARWLGYEHEAGSLQPTRNDE